MKWLTVLIVDDSKADRMLLKEMLRSHENVQFTFIEATSGEEALAVYEKEIADCVLLDFLLQDMTGIEFLETLKKQRIDILPTVFISGYLNRKIVERAFELGVKESLFKEKLSPKELFEGIKQAILRNQALEAPNEEPHAPFKVLIIDDDSASRTLYKKWLQLTEPRENYVFVEAESGKAGLECYLEDKPDCILLDFFMHDNDGFTFMAELKKLWDIPPPIIFITGLHDPRLQEDALAVGASHYFDKNKMSAEAFTKAVKHLAMDKKAANG